MPLAAATSRISSLTSLSPLVAQSPRFVMKELFSKKHTPLLFGNAWNSVSKAFHLLHSKYNASQGHLRRLLPLPKLSSALPCHAPASDSFLIKKGSCLFFGVELCLTLSQSGVFLCEKRLGPRFELFESPSPPFWTRHQRPRQSLGPSKLRTRPFENPRKERVLILTFNHFNAMYCHSRVSIYYHWSTLHGNHRKFEVLTSANRFYGSGVAAFLSSA